MGALDLPLAHAGRRIVNVNFRSHHANGETSRRRCLHRSASSHGPKGRGWRLERTSSIVPAVREAGAIENLAADCGAATSTGAGYRPAEKCLTRQFWVSSRGVGQALNFRLGLSRRHFERGHQPDEQPPPAARWRTAPEFLTGGRWGEARTSDAEISRVRGGGGGSLVEAGGVRQLRLSVVEAAGSVGTSATVTPSATARGRPPITVPKLVPQLRRTVTAVEVGS
jgi:hypothetical protein